MTPAVALAVLAACCAAAGALDGAEALAPRGRRRAPRRAGRLARIGRALGAPRAPADLAARLAAAGLDDRTGPAEVMAAKAGGALAGVLAALALLALAPGRLGLVLVAALPAGAFAVPDRALRRRAARRAHAVALELPDAVELLGVTMAAGLPALAALREVGARRRGVLAEELRALAARVELGEPRALALERLARRAPLPEVAALVALLRRADRHGAPPAAALAALAADARAQRARRLRDDAARAAPKIQLVVALLLVPAAMLLVAAALVEGLT